MPSISIIIATSSRPAALNETLRSLGAVRVPENWPVELVIVENGARCGAEQRVRTFEDDYGMVARYFFEPARGKSRALNLALSQASGDILLFSDDDVRFPSHWIEWICEPIVMDQADAVAGGVRLAPHLLRPWMNHTHRAWLASTADYLSPNNPSEMCGANMAVSRSVFDRIGGFDPELGPGITGGGEESLFSWQLRKSGFRLVGALEVEVEHHLDPDRLQYQSWLKAARLKGEARAYHLHHWFHESIRHPRVRQWFVSAKLALRKACSPRRKPHDEGIAPWELSYVEDIALYTAYERERRRLRNYQRQGPRNLEAECQHIAA